MEGLLFLAECIAIGVILFWIMQNDAAGPGDPTSGLLAMRDVLKRDSKRSSQLPVRPTQPQREWTRRR